MTVLKDMVQEMGGSFTKGQIEALDRSAGTMTATVETSAIEAEKFKKAIQANWGDYRGKKGYYLADIKYINVSAE
ncbi:hypothetical protein N7478_002380 [Penicillium angulare]|uniref:uncharacterized protein n=1 Tax=Penicillium angulare TaxID=116970 RepID=UPI002540B240|nr:uncharacterized protein N7478_002380 [Penicillium angulare]KAJ5286694.1 hypothetical protein N7478_002380 [Penicillium angulare]